jgi:hypothetical protein
MHSDPKITDGRRWPQTRIADVPDKEKSPGGAGVSTGVSAEPKLRGQKAGRVTFVLFNTDVDGAPIEVVPRIGADCQWRSLVRAINQR